MVGESAQDLLSMLCADLRLMRTQAGGPSLRVLAEQVRLSKSQVGAILNGRIRRPPDWQVVGGLVEVLRQYAVEHDQFDRVSLRTGVDEYWRPRYAMLEHTFSQPRDTVGHPGEHTPRPEPAARTSSREVKRVAGSRATAPANAKARSAVARTEGSIAPALLPAAVAGFAGRAGDLAALDAMLATDPDAGAVVITAIGGTAGVGKTTLAVHWAHRVADRFPDGQLYVNLRGFDPDGSVLDPAEALRGFLDSLGVPGKQIPAERNDRIGLYRSVLAGKRVLVVLDNARDVEQVRPLLPGTPGCLAIVTSRDQLSPLVATEGARPLTLDLLTPAEARDLLTHRLGADRVAAQPDAVAEIVTRCARLPLALAIAAARAATQPDFPLSALAAELHDGTGALDALRAGDPGTDLRAVFSWSHRNLSTGAARLFRLLGLHPGPDFSAPAAASLAGLPPRSARALLTTLTRAHLLTEHAPGRYTFHDLLRAYAAEQAHIHDTDSDRRAAVHRLLDHYLHTARTATLLLNPTRDPIGIAAAQPGVTPEDLDHHDDALAWFAAEHRVLLATVDRAASTGFDTHTWQLAWALSVFLLRRGRWPDQIAVQHTALAAAGRRRDRVGQAHASRNLATAHTRLGHLDDAYTHLRQAQRLWADLGDPIGQAHSYLGLVNVAEQRGDLTAALALARLALDRYREGNHQVGQASALNAIGWYHTQLGDHRQGIAYCQQALQILHRLGDRSAEGGTWDSLGFAYRGLADYERSADCYQHAIDVHRSLGDAFEEACALTNLGDTHHAAGNSDAARKAWQEALDIFDRLHHPDADRLRAKLDDPPPPRAGS